MQRTADQIERHIEDEREALRSNLEELHGKLKALVDWRQQFRRNPAALLSAAFGGGLLIALTAARRGARGARLESSPPSVAHGHSFAHGHDGAYHNGRMRRRPLSRALESIQGALITMVVSKLQATVVNLALEFKERLFGREGARHFTGVSLNDPVRGRDRARNVH